MTHVYRRRVVRISALLAVIGLLVAATASGSRAEDDVRHGLAQARKFDGFRVYYDGRRHAGLGLAFVDPLRDFGRRWWSLGYGDCEPTPCGLPLEIQNWSICVRYPAVYPGNVKTQPYRGARAAWVPTAGSFEIYTGKTAVVIFADRHRDLRHAAASLRDVRFAHEVERFKPPAPGSIRGDLPCQR